MRSIFVSMCPVIDIMESLEEGKTCRLCYRKKPAEQFRPSDVARYNYACRPCCSQQYKERRKNKGAQKKPFQKIWWKIVWREYEIRKWSNDIGEKRKRLKREEVERIFTEHHITEAASVEWTVQRKDVKKPLSMENYLVMRLDKGRERAKKLEEFYERMKNKKP